MVELAEYAILIIPPLTIDCLERCSDVKRLQLCWILYLCQAVVLVVLDNALAFSFFEKCGVRKDELASFKFSWVRWEQVLHQPLELALFHLFTWIFLYVALNIHSKGLIDPTPEA